MKAITGFERCYNVPMSALIMSLITVSEELCKCGKRVLVGEVEQVLWAKVVRSSKMREKNSRVGVKKSCD